MAINLQSLSLTSAFSAIVNFFKSQENNQKWKDLTQGSEGTFLIRLLANIFSTLSYRVVAQARENYLSTAALPSSNIGLAVNLGYSVFRGSNLKRLIRITPNGNYTIPRLAQIGTFNETYNIYTLDEATLEEGVPTEIRTVVGNIKEETIIAGTSANKVFTLFTTGISEDFVLYVDAKEVPTTNVIKDMTEDKYLVRTNPYSSVDIMYLNTFPNFNYHYGTNSEITLRYVELADVGDAEYTDGMFSYGTLNGVSNISSYLPFESVENIKINAPLDHETQNLIRSKQDYANRLQQIVPAAISTDWMAITPTYTQITYLKNDFTLLTEEEQRKVLELLEGERYFGTPLPDLTYPRREVAHLKISIALTNKYKNIADINLDIENILKSYYDARLGATFNTFDLERKIESLSYVKYARVEHFLNEREANTAYQLGYMVSYEGNSYMATKILGTTGETTPRWNLPSSTPHEIDTGYETQDGNLVWRAYKKLPNMDLPIWRSTGQFGIGDFMQDPRIEKYMFKCVNIIKSSGFYVPDLTYAEAGDFFVDGAIVWVAKEYSSSYDNWAPTTNYTLGDSVNVPTSSDFSLECISYTGATGPETNMDFELPVYNILSQTTSSFVVGGNKTFYFDPNTVFTALHEGGSDSYVVSSSVFDGYNTTINVVGDLTGDTTYTELVTEYKGTKDGQILWTVIEDPTNVTYPWNSYAVFDHTLEIIE